MSFVRKWVGEMRSWVIGCWEEHGGCLVGEFFQQS